MYEILYPTYSLLTKQLIARKKILCPDIGKNNNPGKYADMVR
jgi:hypothetical protein